MLKVWIFRNLATFTTNLKSKSGRNLICRTTLESQINRSASEPTAEELEDYKEQFLDSYAERVTVDEPAAAGDYVICDLTFVHDGKTIREIGDQSLRVMPQLDFQDAVLEGFDTADGGCEGRRNSHCEHSDFSAVSSR